jgi:transposase
LCSGAQSRPAFHPADSAALGVGFRAHGGADRDHLPAAKTIHLVLDNLNIHCRKSLVGCYGEECGECPWKRFSVHYTPKHGSWLNQAEIEISLFSRQCLGRRRFPIWPHSNARRTPGTSRSTERKRKSTGSSAARTPDGSLAIRRTKSCGQKTSKWNKIEHRLFSFISQNWRGKPLISHQVIIDLIALTTTKTGLTVKSKLNTNTYEQGIKVSDQQMAELQLRKEKFHGDWNYRLLPRS